MKRTVILVFSIVAAFGLFFGCWQWWQKEKNTPKYDVVKMGVVLPSSGTSAKLGEPKKRAFEIAEEQFNKNGKRLEILYGESYGTNEGGVSAFKNLLLDKDINCYYIDLTTIVNSCVPIVNDHKVITFAGSAQPEITDSSDYLFRIFAGGEQEIELMIQYLQQQNIQNVFILYTNELYGSNACRYFKTKFTNLGGNIIGEDSYPMNNNDYKDQLEKVKNAKPEKVILLGYGNEYPTLFRQTLEYGLTTDLFVCNLGGSNKSVMELPAELTEGIAFVGPRFSYLLDNDMLKPEMKEFVDLYKTKHEELPDFRAAYAYDMVCIFMDVFGDGSKSDQQIMEDLKAIKNYKGVSGTISFKDNGDTETELVTAQYHNGKMMLIDL